MLIIFVIFPESALKTCKSFHKYIWTLTYMLLLYLQWFERSFIYSNVS